MSKYPTEITQKVLDGNASISNDIITKDIDNAEIEIRALEKEIKGYRLIGQATGLARDKMAQFRRDGKRLQVMKGQEFVIFLKALLQKREEVNANRMQELARKVTTHLRRKWGNDFTDEDAVRIYDFCVNEVDEKISYPFHEGDIFNVAMKYELRYR